MRARTKHNDRDFFIPGNRPPAPALPASLKTIADERDDLVRRQSYARSALADQTAWAKRYADAVKADASSVVEATRRGQDLENPTTHTDAYALERDKLRREVESVEAAIRVVDGEFATARDAELRTNLTKYDKQLADVRARLQKTAHEADAAMQQATEVMALREWLEAHVYDASTYVPRGDIEDAERQQASIHVHAIGKAIRNYAGEGQA